MSSWNWGLLAFITCIFGSLFSTSSCLPLIIFCIIVLDGRQKHTFAYCYLPPFCDNK